MSENMVEFDYYGISLYFSIDGLKELKGIAVKDNYQSAMYALGVACGVGDQAAYDKAYESICLKINKLLLTRPCVIDSMLADGYKLADNIANIDIKASLSYLVKTRDFPFLNFEFSSNHEVRIDYFEPKSYLGGLVERKGKLLNSISFKTYEVEGYMVGSKNTIYILTHNNPILILRGHLFSNSKT